VLTTNKEARYRHPGDLRKNYSKFYWNGVYPYVKDALHYLSLTQEGKQIVANLYCNVFVVEHEQAAEREEKLRLAEAAA